MDEFTVEGHLNIEKFLETIAMIISKRENVKVTLKIEKASEQLVNNQA
ncbi:hypothetical protein [Clostridium saccharoperbutylacetonicum]